MMKQNKIIITIDWFLPGTKSGGPVRSIANLVGQIKDFRFFILTRNHDYCSDEIYKTVPTNTWINHNENTKVYYFSDEKLTKKNFENILLEVSPDVIYINGIYSKCFSIWPLLIANKHKIKNIVASRGMLSPHGLSVKKLKKKLFLKLINLKSIYRHTVFHATQEDEAEHIKAVINRFNNIEVLPNLPRVVSHEEESLIEKKSGDLNMIYLGRVAQEKGTLVALKALLNCKGQLSLDIYGTIYDENYWEKCKAVINKLPQQIKVTYKGNLDSEEVLQTIKNYHGLLLYSFGENYGHAIVESFLARRPVIISKHTPWKGLQEKNMGFDVEQPMLSQAIQTLIDYNQEEFDESCHAIDKQIDDLLEIKSNLLKYKFLFERW